MLRGVSWLVEEAEAVELLETFVVMTVEKEEGSNGEVWFTCELATDATSATAATLARAEAELDANSVNEAMLEATVAAIEGAFTNEVITPVTVEVASSEVA